MGVRSRLAAFAIVAAFAGSATRASAGSLWVRLDVVENTAEGPAAERCEIERIVNGSARWSVFYGEARRNSDSTFEVVRPRGGCAATPSGRAPQPREWRGSPYMIVDIALSAAESDARIEASLAIRKLKGFDSSGRPTYERTSDKRTFRVGTQDGVVFPVLLASPKEIEQLRVRELLFRWRAQGFDGRERVEYGEIAVASDVPRASILLDGGFVGWTSEDQPVVLRTVPTGARAVVVRDISGRERHLEVQVTKGQTSNATFSMLPEATATVPNGLRPLGTNPQGGEELWREKDGAIVVRVPGGQFQMGSPEGQGEPGEHPRHRVQLRPFLIDKAEVTWGQYRRFAAQTSRALPPAPVWGTPEVFAVSNVTWSDAQAYCTWAGGRLPTEAEWERAARGDNESRYPWGENWESWRCNLIDGGPHAPTAAGSLPDCVSPYGVLDIAGGVWEWCHDWYDAAYYAASPLEDPRGPDSGKRRVSRGGAWINPSSWARSAYRQATEPQWRYPLRGFRCAQDDRRGDGT